MSTILDALSRAERERRMGQMPAIERALLERSPAVDLPGQRRNSRLAWLSGATVLAVVVLTVVLVYALHEPGATAPQLVAPGALAGAISPDHPLAGQAAAPIVAPVPDKAELERPAARPAASHPQRMAHEPVHRPKAVEAKSGAGAVPEGGVAVSAQKPDNRPVKAEPAIVKVPPAPPPLLSELPAATRQELPPISLGGYIYSANAADRSILINGKLLREGDQLAPGLRLEQMRPDGVVFGYRDLRFRMAY